MIMSHLLIILNYKVWLYGIKMVFVITLNVTGDYFWVCSNDHLWFLKFPTFMAAQESICDAKLISELFWVLPKRILINGRLLAMVRGMQQGRLIPF